jgi:hypothetical protein
MPVYDAERFKPPAPVATVLLCTRDQAKTVADVPMLIESGADLTLIPRRCVRELGLRDEPIDGFLEGFDGSTSPARVVNIEVHFLDYIFRGLFPVTEDECGILGRNVMNRLSLVLDGPRLTWPDVSNSD